MEHTQNFITQPPQYQQHNHHHHYTHYQQYPIHQDQHQYQHQDHHQTQHQHNHQHLQHQQRSYLHNDVYQHTPYMQDYHISLPTQPNLLPSQNNQIQELQQDLQDQLQQLPDNLKVAPFPFFLCEYCQKISDTCYFCYNRPCNFLRKIQQFQLYNEPNGLTVDQIVSHCDNDFIYEENLDNKDRIYDPQITRCKIEDEYVNGKKVKKDHPGFCKYCTLYEDHWDSNFYERNNSRYRGHMINTHGIHPNGCVVKLPETGYFCYKWVRNHWFETSGFFCPYPDCNEAFAIGEKGHGFHEYLRHWSKKHIKVKTNSHNNRLGRSL